MSTVSRSSVSMSSSSYTGFANPVIKWKSKFQTASGSALAIKSGIISHIMPLEKEHLGLL